MLLDGSETYGDLGVLPGMALTYDHVPTFVRFAAPWGEQVTLRLSVAAQCEMATEGAVLVPVVHLRWGERTAASVGHQHNVLVALQ